MRVLRPLSLIDGSVGIVQVRAAEIAVDPSVGVLRQRPVNSLFKIAGVQEPHWIQPVSNREHIHRRLSIAAPDKFRIFLPGVRYGVRDLRIAFRIVTVPSLIFRKFIVHAGYLAGPGPARRPTAAYH